MNKPTLKISELQKQGLLNENLNPIETTNNKRMLRLKFYFDNLEREQINKIGSFPVASIEDGARILVQFENEGAKIRAAFLTPNNQLGKKMSFRFEYKDLPYYKFLKGSN